MLQRLRLDLGESNLLVLIVSCVFKNTLKRINKVINMW